MKSRFFALVVLAIALPMASAAQPEPPARGLASKALVDRAAATGRVRVVVELGGVAATPEHLLPHAGAIAGQRSQIAQAQADIRRALRSLAHRVHREYTSMPYMALEVGPDGLRMLEAMRGFVTRIDEDIELHPMLGESSPLVQAPTAWAAGRDGQGTVIAIIDTGVDKNHVFLNGKVIEEACFLQGPNGPGGSGGCPNGLDTQLGPGAGVPCATFECEHGTHVAGIAAGNGAAPANVPFSGVAKGASLMAVRVLDDTGSAAGSDVLAGLERVYLIRGMHNFASVNMSLGVPNVAQFTTCDTASPAMTTVIQNLRAAGIATVIASGNDHFTNAISFPACISAAVSVGSSDDGSLGTTVDRVSLYSNIAPFVSLLAPGQWITSSIPGDNFDTFRGTSMAAPHVAGAFAILKQGAPTRTVTDLLNALRNTGLATADVASTERPGGQGTVLPRIRVADALGALGTVQFSSAAFATAEADTATITVTRTGSTDGPATVHYATTNGTALGGTHYTPTSGTLTFGPGEATRTFTVVPIDNTVVNPNRTVNLTLSGPSPIALGTPATAVLTIVNDDEGGTIALATSSLQVAENGGPALVEVVRTGSNLASGVTVHFATANGTGMAAVAYTATSGTLTFAAGATSLTFAVPILDNTLLGGDKTFQVALSTPGGGGTLGTPASAIVTILEDDTAGTFQFSSATYAAIEGGPAASITVTRTGTKLAAGVAIHYATSNGTATAGADYTATAGTLTFGAGVTSLSFLVPIMNDVILEPAETVNLTLTVPAGSPAVLGAPATAVLTIQDNDAPVIRFALAAQSVAEGSTASVVVMRAGGLNAAVTVGYEVAAGGTATGGGVDYTLASGTLSFAVNQTSATIPVPTVNDTLFEGPETILLQLVSPAGGAVMGTPAATTLTITDNDSPGTVQFSAAAYSVAENVAGGVFNLVVTRTGTNLASGIVVNYAVTGGTATNGADYVLADGSLTFAVGVTSLPIPVTIQDDQAPEGNETVVVTLSSATATLGAIRTTTLTILDDEQALTFSAVAYAATEGVASMAIPILRAGPTPAGTTVICRTNGGTAVPDFDYRPVNTTLTFAAASRVVTCVVPLLNNTIVDGARTINLELAIPLGGLGLLGAPAAAVLTLNDNDQGGVIRFGAATYTVAEGATASLTVMRTGVNLASNVSVNYAVTGGTATGGGVDYTLAAGTLSFGAGVASLPILVPTVNDTLAEGPETVVVTLSGSTGGATLGTPAATTLTITDNDSPGTVQFSAAAYSVAENVLGGVFNMVVTRTGTNLASNIVVNYAVTGGTALGGGIDYTLADGSLTFGVGVTSLPIPVLITNDPDPEGNETVVVTLSSATATLGPIRTTTLTILDDEQALTFSLGAYAVTEGATSMAIPILRSGPTPAGTTVICRTALGGSAVPDFDYRPVNTTLTFAAASRMVTCVVPLLNNTIVDGARTINLELAIPLGGLGLLGAPAAAVLTLNDNDQGGVIRFGAATYTVAEGATASLTVMRTGVNLASNVSVNYAVTGGTATGGGVDYTLAAGTLSFGAGVTSLPILVPTVNDTFAEGPETVVVTLSTPTGGAALGTPAATTLTITDNDSPGTVQFSAAAYSVAENVLGGVFNLIVTRTGTNLASGIIVNYAVTGGTATNGVDYVLADGSLTFAVGVTSLPIPVIIQDDHDAEGNETVVVTLSSPTATLGAVHVTTLTIVDDEQVLSFSALTYLVAEGTASIAIPILRAGPTPAGTTVTCQSVGGTAVPDFDYRAVNTTLTFAAGARSVTCMVPILNDTVVDGPRTVDLALSVAPGGSVLLGTLAAAQLTINDNDQGGLIRFGATAYTVNEGAIASLTLMRSGVNLAGGVTVDYAVTDGTATSDVDFVLAAGTVTFGAGQTSATIQVTALTDNVFDNNETFVVTLVNPTSGATIGAPAATTVTIRDTTPPAQVRFVNNVVACDVTTCQAFTARLRAEENYTWLSRSGVFSAYQKVTSATLSNFVLTAVEFPGAGSLTFQGSFPIASNVRYLMQLDVDEATQIFTLSLAQEGSVSMYTSIAAGFAGRVPSMTSATAPPGLHFAPLGR